MLSEGVVGRGPTWWPQAVLGMGRQLDPGSPVPSGPAAPHALCTAVGRGVGQVGGRVGISLEAAGLLLHRTLPQLLAWLRRGRGGRGRWGFRQVQNRVLSGLHPKVGLDLVVPGLAVTEVDDTALVGAFVCGLHP